MSDQQEDAFWQEVYSQREAFYSKHFGSLPDEIQKMMNMTGVWPGGGLFEIEATNLGPDLWIYSTFGLTNPDMPTRVTMEDFQASENQYSSKIVQKEQVPSYPDRPGYGYEMMVVTQGKADWPFWFIQWAVNAELISDTDLLGRVSEYDGLTIQDIQVGETEFANFLIHRAADPLASSMTLPNGEATLLVATSVTDDEMIWSMSDRRSELLSALQTSGHGQKSDLTRQSVIHPEPLDFAQIVSQEVANENFDNGLLRRMFLFPPELGGEESDRNTLFVPKRATIRKDEIDFQIMQLAQDGQINNYAASPEYKGDSVIPSSIRIEASGEVSVDEVIDIW